jgi:hypothetical protein
MKQKFIIDKEINLKECDYLKTKVYAENLTKIIKNTESGKVFTIGLFGNWGTGKSSIIKTSQQDFDEKKIKFITYDSWQYVNDSFRRMFLRKLREDLQYEEKDLMKKFYENESTDLGNKYQLSPTRLAFILGGLILLLAILAFIPFQIDYKAPIYAIFTLLGLLITIISGAFHQLKISVTKPHLFAPEQFEECFKEMVSNSLSRINTADKVLKWVNGDKSIQNLEKLVIVIDNIDRCSNDVAYNLLTDIKTFFSSEPYSIVFVIPVDDEALKKHIIKNSKSEDSCDREKEEFLRKFFNVTIRIKPYGETDMYSFAKKTCEKSGLNFKPETINVASKEYAKNPRRIIQLFNNLLAELNYYEVDFVQRNETLICCILIIREEYSGYYEKIVNYPKLFNEECSGEEDDLKRFIRIAQTTLGKVEISDLSEVLINSHHHFDDIASDIKDVIVTFEVKKVLTVWENEKEQIMNYIFDRLDNSIKNDLIETELVAYFDLMAQINISFPMEIHTAKKIDEKILPYLSSVILKTKNYENLCKYTLLRETQRDARIKTALIEECKRSKDQEKDSHWKSLFNAVLKIFQDEKTSTDLSETYTMYHSNVDLTNFSKEQIEGLLSNKYVRDRLADLPKDDNEEILLDVETEEYQKIKWIFEHKKNITEETYAHLFAKIIGTTNDESRMRGKTIDEIAEILNFINPLLDLIPDRKLATQPQTLYGLIVNDRKMPHTHPNYYNSPQYDQQKNFIDECINEEKYISEIIDFVFNIYRITNNETDVKNEIDKLLPHTNLNNEFIQLINKGYSLTPILDLAFDIEDDFADSNRLEVLRHCFNQKNDKGEYTIVETKAKTKLDNLLTYAQDNKAQEVFTLLNTISAQKHYNALLANLIISKDSTFINSLPSEFLQLAVNSFGNSNYNDYVDNLEFLMVIAEHGSNDQKKLLVQILQNKIDNNNNIHNVLKIVAVLVDISNIDPEGLLALHLQKYKRENKDTVEDELKKEIDKAIKKLKKDIKE